MKTFFDDACKAREIWGEKQSWVPNPKTGESKADRAWNALVWSALHHGQLSGDDKKWTEKMLTVLESSYIEYSMRIKLMLGL